MASTKSDHITVFRPNNGTGIQQMCAQVVSHAKTTGHGIDDVIAELAWQWFKNSQPSATKAQSS